MLDRLDWDSAFFGFTVARVRSQTMTEAEARDLAAASDAMGARCVYFLSPHSPSWRAAIAVGFEPIDIRVELVAESSTHDAPRALATARDEADLLAIVREGAFEQSRFLRDSRFPRDKAAEMFEIWMRRGLDETGWFTVRDENGFVTCSESAIQLVAVAERARGRGAGKRLVRDALAEFASRGVAQVSVVTQGANIAAERLYADCGFRTSSVALWLHRWSNV